MIGVTEGHIQFICAKMAKGVVCELENIFMQVSYMGYE